MTIQKPLSTSYIGKALCISLPVCTLGNTGDDFIGLNIYGGFAPSPDFPQSSITVAMLAGPGETPLAVLMSPQEAAIVARRLVDLVKAAMAVAEVQGNA